MNIEFSTLRKYCDARVTHKGVDEQKCFHGDEVTQCAEANCPLRATPPVTAIPDNEFSDHATADMHSMDSAHHYMLNPEKSDFPDAARRQREWYQEKVNIVTDNSETLKKALARIEELEATIVNMQKAHIEMEKYR